MYSRTPFGNPDGSRSDIQEVIESFVSFGQHHLGIPAEDMSVRIVVGAKGSGKTVYLRRLQAAAASNESVYTGAVQQDLPVTSNVVKFCQCFRKRDLTEKWMQLWYSAILRSLVSHFLHAKPLSFHLTEEQREELAEYPEDLVPKFRREVSIYSQVTDIINRHHTDHAFSQFFDQPGWAELATTLGDILTSMPPVYFFVDSVDEEYANAPMFWLQCQKGLFFRTMRFLRDQHFGGRLHIVACVRDHVLASVLRGEHQNRYRGEPHILSLEWDYGAARYFLEQKIYRLDDSLFMRPKAERKSIEAWLGIDEIENRSRGTTEPITQYLLRHTRLLPRDIVILGNLLCQEIITAKHNGATKLEPRAIRRCVHEAAKSFGNEQLAICANHIASNGMPSDAVRLEYDEIYTGDSEYSRGITENLVEVIQLIGKDRFTHEDLEVANLHATDLFGEGSDALSVLWQNRLVGYAEKGPDGPVETFFSERSSDHFNLPRDKKEYCFHSTMIDRVGIDAIGAPVGQPPLRTSIPTPVPPTIERRGGDDDDRPEQIGGYPILDELGQGGMGVVYLAEDPQLKRRIAIKVLPDRFADDPKGLARFRREAQTLAGLNHPNIATIYSMQEEGEQRFLTMEFVCGKTLHERLDDGPIPPAEVVRIGEQVGRALTAAHRAGVVHRDLKPANVMLTDEADIKVLDFGLAKALSTPVGDSAITHHSTAPDILLGTPGYMSPEQIRGHSIDARADIWGLGCLLFECLCGEQAFCGETPMGIISATLETEPDWDNLGRAPRKLRRLIRQCLEKNPEKRFASIAEVMGQLTAMA